MGPPRSASTAMSGRCARARRTRAACSRGRRVRQVHAQHVDAGVQQPLERAGGILRRSDRGDNLRPTLRTTSLYASRRRQKAASGAIALHLTRAWRDRHIAETWTSLRLVGPMRTAGRNLTVPERTERVEASDLEIKTLGPVPLRIAAGRAARPGGGAPGWARRAGAARRSLLGRSIQRRRCRPSSSPARATASSSTPPSCAAGSSPAAASAPASTTWCAGWCWS